MPQVEYARWDGSQQFRPLSAEDAFDRLAEHLLEYGEQALRYLDRLEPPDQSILDQMTQAGLLERDDKGRYAVSPKGVRRMQNRALADLYQPVNRGGHGKHETSFRGPGEIRHDDQRPYRFGDSISNIDLTQSMRQAVGRQRKAPPIEFDESDLVVHETEQQTSCATVLLLDMSGSMARYGKYAQAKRVALALYELTRSQFPEDTLRSIGFFTYAGELAERDLVRSAPKPVSLFDPRVFLRIPIERPPGFVPEHFTNIQLGLQLARRVLQRESAANKQIVCITDGEPTAHVEGKDLMLIYPPSERTAQATLEEATQCRQAGIRLSTVALIEDYFYLDLKNFVDELARCSRGIAVYCNASELGVQVLDSFVNGRRARRTLR